MKKKPTAKSAFFNLRVLIGLCIVLTGVFIVCMCSLMLQIMETRLLSVIAWYYMAFFAISMAMFGMTGGSLIVYFKSQLFTRERLHEHLAWIAVALAISVVLSTASLVSSVVPASVTSGMMILLWLKLIVSILLTLRLRRNGGFASADA